MRSGEEIRTALVAFVSRWRDYARGLRDFADDVAALLDLFRAPPVVVGHSIGGRPAPGSAAVARPIRPATAPDEGALLDTVLSTVVGEDNYPGARRAARTGRRPGPTGAVCATRCRRAGAGVADPLVVLDRYRAAGGAYTGTVFSGCGHSPHIERPAESATVPAGLVGAPAGR